MVVDLHRVLGLHPIFLIFKTRNLNLYAKKTQDLLQLLADYEKAFHSDPVSSFFPCTNDCNKYVIPISQNTLLTFLPTTAKERILWCTPWLLRLPFSTTHYWNAFYYQAPSWFNYDPFLKNFLNVLRFAARFKRVQLFFLNLKAMLPFVVHCHIIKLKKHFRTSIWYP